MTVSSETNKISHVGTGGQTTFSTSFLFDADDEVVVTLIVDATSVETEWTQGTEYTLTGAGTGAAGTVTVDTSPTDYTPATGETLVIQLKPDFLQGTSLPRGGTVSPKGVLEPMHDKRVRQLLRIKDGLDRALLAPISESSIGNLPTATNRASKLFSFDASGDPTAVAAADVNLAAVTAFGLTLLDDVDAAAARVTLGAPAILSAKTTAPGVNDDTTFGYVVGDIWPDTTNDKVYVAIDITDGAAVWAEIGTVADNAITLAKMEHGTSGDILYYGASGTPTRLAKGSDDQVLTLASGVPSWAAAGGAVQYVGISTISGDPTAVEFAELESGYDHIFVFDGIGPTGDGVSLDMTTSPDTDDTPIYDTTSGDYEWTAHRQSSTGGGVSVAANASDVHAQLTDTAVGNQAAEVLSGTMEITNPRGSNGYTRGFVAGSFGDTGGGMQTTRGHWARQEINAVGAVRFAWSDAGAYANLGSIRHYKRATS